MWFSGAEILLNQDQCFSTFELKVFSTEREAKKYFKKYSAIHYWELLVENFSDLHGEPSLDEQEPFCMDELPKPRDYVDLFPSTLQDTSNPEVASEHSESESDSDSGTDYPLGMTQGEYLRMFLTRMYP